MGVRITLSALRIITSYIYSALQTRHTQIMKRAII